MRRLVVALLTVASCAAVAHDSWFEPLPGPRQQLALGTGTRFPGFEFPFGWEQLVSGGCHKPSGGTQALAFVADRPHALWVRPAESGPVRSCWAQIAPVDAVLEPAIVTIYLDEIRASARVRADWAALQRQGLPWRERYTKHARIELGTAPETPFVSRPAPMAMDVQLQAPRWPVRVGDQVTFQVLRDQQPLPGLAMELHTADGLPGSWQTTDTEGRVRFTVGSPGRWLLRGTELRRDPQDPGLWLGGFVTLVFTAIK